MRPGFLRAKRFFGSSAALNSNTGGGGAGGVFPDSGALEGGAGISLEGSTGGGVWILGGRMGSIDGARGGDRVGRFPVIDIGTLSSDGDGSDTGDLEDVVDGESEGKGGGSDGGGDVVQSLDEGRTLVPGHLVSLLEHVSSGPSGNGDEGDVDGVVTGVLQEEGGLLLDFLVSGLSPVGGGVVHLVDGNDHLLNTEGVG